MSALTLAGDELDAAMRQLDEQLTSTDVFDVELLPIAMSRQSDAWDDIRDDDDDNNDNAAAGDAAAAADAGFHDNAADVEFRRVPIRRRSSARRICNWQVDGTELS
jgi:hypothetical protein